MIYDDPNFDNMTTDDIKQWVQDFESPFFDLSPFFNPGLEETGQTYICRSFFYTGLMIS